MDGDELCSEPAKLRAQFLGHDSGKRRAEREHGGRAAKLARSLERRSELEGQVRRRTDAGRFHGTSGTLTAQERSRGTGAIVVSVANATRLVRVWSAPASPRIPHGRSPHGACLRL